MLLIAVRDEFTLEKPPPDSRKATGGRASGLFISAFQCWLFPGIFPTADKSRRTRTKTAETGENAVVRRRLAEIQCVFVQNEVKRRVLL